MDPKQNVPKKENEGDWIGKQFYDIERHLKSPKGRSELSKELGIFHNDYKKQDEEIEDLLEMIPKIIGPTVDKNEKISLKYKFDQESFKQKEKPYESQDWEKEGLERKISEKERNFLKKKFGIK